jgi:chlorobactene glucosyltransferase
MFKSPLCQPHHIRCYNQSMFIFGLILLSMIAILWVGLLLSPVHAWTHQNPLNSDTKFEGPKDDVSQKDPWPLVTLIVPARNEAAWLPTTVPTFCEQAYPNIRVIVVDDQSGDASSEILSRLAEKYPDLTVVQAHPRPESWCGKPWAVHQGVTASSTLAPNAENENWFLFTDADCILHPQAVSQAMTLARQGCYDAVSLLAHMTFGSPLEQIALTGLATVLNLVMPMGKSNDPKSSIALAAGGFILVRQSIYEKIGGHEAVKAQIIEDVYLGRKLKASGAKLHTRATADLVSTRMYEGFADLWEGLSKNAYAGMDYDPKKFWVGTVIAILVAVLPPVYLLATAIVMAVSPSRAHFVLLALSIVIVTCQALIHLRTVRHMKLPRWHGLLMPASAGLYTVITCNSVWQHHFGGGNLWKGRRYHRDMLLDAVTGEQPSIATKFSNE